MAKQKSTKTRKTTSKKGRTNEVQPDSTVAKSRAKKPSLKKRELPITINQKELFPLAGIVILTITFKNVAAGNSLIVATCNGERSTRTTSGTITFSGVKKDDIIGIDGSSAGKTKIEINVDAIPQEMNFEPGNFNDNFLIN